MKKISLKTVKNSMKRDEMRSVKGGSGCCGSTNTSQCYVVLLWCASGKGINLSGVDYCCK